jgi:hypothetical protein
MSCRTSIPGVLGLGAIALSTVANPPAANEAVRFPESYRAGVHYTTVTRGGIREEIFTSAEALAAAKAGEPLPDGTVITMEDHRDGKLHRYIVMEKREAWQSLSEAGAWLFREFAPDRTPNVNEDGSRCASCHQSQAANDYVFTNRQMREHR